MATQLVSSIVSPCPYEGTVHRFACIFFPSTNPRIVSLLQVRWSGNNTLINTIIIPSHLYQSGYQPILTPIRIRSSTSWVTLNHIRFVFYHKIKDNEINICLDNWKHRLGLESARAALCKWAACTRQTFLSKTFTKSSPRASVFLCVYPVIDHEFRHHIVKVAEDLQTTLTMLWRNSWSITGQTY